MIRYKFLFKPLFFIFNLLFASWLVLKIEKLSPSDFGKHRSLFEGKPKPLAVHHIDTCRHVRGYLLNLCSDYKNGQINDSTLYKKIEKLVVADERIYN